MAGRGKATSFTQEQLQTLGVGRDLPVQTAPPPTYPPLMTKPITLETTAAQNYQILWKEDFLSNMWDSPYFLKPKVDTKVPSHLRRYSEQWADAVEYSKVKVKPDFHWELMPSELQPTTRKRRVPRDSKNVGVKKVKTANIEDRLKVLEEKERTENDLEAPAKANSDTEPEEEEEVAVDEEMDDENDYGNSYFDNGEAYNEDDDNLDDGPVY